MSFQKGKPRPSKAGRKKGVPNKLTTEVKVMVENALSRLGGEKWLVSAAKENPAAFMTLVGKLLPKDVNMNATFTDMTEEQLRARLTTLLTRLKLNKGEHVGGAHAEQSTATH